MPSNWLFMTLCIRLESRNIFSFLFSHLSFTRVLRLMLPTATVICCSSTRCDFYIASNEINLFKKMFHFDTLIENATARTRVGWMKKLKHKQNETRRECDGRVRVSCRDEWEAVTGLGRESNCKADWAWDIVRYITRSKGFFAVRSSLRNVSTSIHQWHSRSNLCLLSETDLCQVEVGRWTFWLWILPSSDHKTLFTAFIIALHLMSFCLITACVFARVSHRRAFPLHYHIIPKHKGEVIYGRV